MKNYSKWIGLLTFMAGVLMLSLSLRHPALAQPPVLARGSWYSIDTTPTFPPGVAGTIQATVGNLNRNGGADAVVYVPELHCLFAHYSH